MGPFPHHAPRASISPENPAGTDGFEFVEFAHPNPDELRALFARMGYALTARHKTKAVELWQQGDITYVLNDEPGSHARRFVSEHGPCAPSMCWRVGASSAAVARNWRWSWKNMAMRRWRREPDRYPPLPPRRGLALQRP